MPIVELPMLPRGNPVCPAGERIDGVATHDGGCVCRIMQRDQDEESGLDMNPAQLEVAREGTGGVYLTVKSDPSTVHRLCWGTGLPSMSSDDEAPHDSYTHCPVWQQRRDRDIAHRRKLYDPVVPDAVAMGVEMVDDPPMPTQRDLRELAPLPRDRVA